MKQYWPKKAFQWLDGDTLYVSVPFTWNLPQLKQELSQRSFFWKKAVVGGPALAVMPDFFKDMPWVEVGDSCNGVLQRVNPYATRTSWGCPNSCGFCAVRLIEGEFREMTDWPDLPVIADSNLLACSFGHFDKVMDRLEKHEECDFASGLDIRFLTEYHAERLARLKNPMIRFALDDPVLTKTFVKAMELLFSVGISKSKIRVFVLIGFNTDPLECWQRCEFIENMGIMVNAMWYHPLDCLEWNSISKEQYDLGWTHKERTKIMGWYYARRGVSPLMGIMVNAIKYPL